MKSFKMSSMKQTHTSSMRVKAFKSRNKNSGATIVEILIAVLILSFGLLGMAALQTRALQGNQSSVARSQAIMLAYNIADAMRIDRVQAAVGQYNITNVAAGGVSADGSLAKNNLINWLNSARDNLGGTSTDPVRGTINCNGQASCTISLSWNDDRQGGIGAQTITIQTTL
jgi:type IV pilus assembly protein PilV